MAFLNSLSQIRAVEWSRNYLWDIRFDDKDLAGTFKDWFPATTLEEQAVSIQSHILQIGMLEFKVPYEKKVDTIKLTFIDDAAQTLYSFFKKWMEVTIAHNGNYIATLSEAVKTLQIAKLKPDKTPITNLTRTLYVFPDGSLTFNGTANESKPNSYSITFVVAGKK